VPLPSEDRDLKPLIDKLSSANPAVRSNAAGEIFRHGSELAHAVAAPWLGDPQFASCLCQTEASEPKITVGIAVKRQTFSEIRAANGSPRLASVPDDQDVEEFELDFPGAIRLDVLTTKRGLASGAIEKFLQKYGEGIQQIELETRDVNKATKILRSRFGVTPVYAQSRAGADGTRVNFFLVPSRHRNVLIELVESP